MAGAPPTASAPVTRGSTRKIVGAYLVCGLAWALASEPWDGQIHPAEKSSALTVDLANRLAFVGGSAALLALLLRYTNKRAEQAHQARLAEASRYRALLDASLDAVHVVDLEGALVEANRAFYRQLGYDLKNPPPLSVRDWDAHFSPAEIKEKIQSLVGSSAIFETVHRKKDGTLIQVEVSATSITLEGRTLVMCIARDLTVRNQLQRVQLRAERLESLGLLAGGVAHDLNNALSPIILGADLLRARGASASDDVLLGSMSTAAKRAAGIIRQLLTFSRGIQGERILLPIRPLLVELARIQKAGSPAGLRVDFDCEESLPGVRGDAAQLQQALRNLLQNARDAMPAGGTLTLGARMRRLDETDLPLLPRLKTGPHVEIYVRDTGPGLTREAREHLFEPFFTTKARGQATGLGLSTALGIVRSHGGVLEHLVPPGGGAEFRILLPAAASDEPAPRQPAPAPKPPSAARGDGRVVLLVEDDGLVRGSTRLLLETRGFSVMEAEDGAQALAILEQGAPPDLILTDLMMPRLSGDALALAIRPRLPNLPIIAMTGLHAEDPRAPHLRPLLDDGTLTLLLAKPFDETQLLAALERALATDSMCPART